MATSVDTGTATCGSGPANFTISSMDDFVSLCGSQLSNVLADRPATIDDVYIDPSIQGSERTYLQNEMIGMPVSLIQDFVCTDISGNLHANKPALLANSFICPITSSGTYIGADGVEFSATDGGLSSADNSISATEQGKNSSGSLMYRLDKLQPSVGANRYSPLLDECLANHSESVNAFVLTPPTESKGTGPYRRIYERARASGGLYYGRADGVIPDRASINEYSAAPKDTAYIYMSPWTETPNPDPKFDYGLQYSHSRHVWDWFLNKKGAYSSWNGNIPDGSYEELVCTAIAPGKIYLQGWAWSSTRIYWYRNTVDVPANIYPHSPYLAFAHCNSIAQTHEGMNGSFFLNYRDYYSITDDGGFGSDSIIHPSVLMQPFTKFPIVWMSTGNYVNIDTRK